jgi:putative ABC transport system permease protein
MLYNYLKVILRNFMNDRLFTVIIVVGLAIGLSCCLIIAQYIEFELSFDKDVKDRNQIYYSYLRWQSSEGEYDVLCHPSIGPLLKSSVPEVSSVIRFAPALPYGEVNTDELILRRELNGEVIYNERQDGIYFADPEIITFFSLHMSAGDAESALIQPYTMVITESLSRKLFPGESALDKTVTVQSGRWMYDLRVTGILEDPKPNSSFRFEVLISMPTLSISAYNAWNQVMDDRWDDPFYRTFIKVRPGTDPLILERKINEAAKKYLIEAQHQYNIKQSIRLYPFSEYHFYRAYNNWGIATIKFAGDKRLLRFFGLLTALILIVSWANYINLTTARALRRAKEVGVRKVSGASRRNIIVQFLTEFLFLNIISIFLAFTLAQLFFHQFAQVIGSKAEWSFWSEPIFWLIMTMFIIVSTIASGFYPAFLVSNYNPSKVLVGNSNKSQLGGSLRKGLVLVQFGISVFMLMSIYVISRQLIHLQKKNLGMTPDQVLVLNTAGLDTALLRNTAFEQWKLKVNDLAHVKSTCAVDYYPGAKAWRMYFYLSSDPAKAIKGLRLTEVTADYPKTMGIPLLHGRDLSDETYDLNKAVISEKAARELGYSDVSLAVGKSITLSQREFQYEIIGVMKDHQLSAKDIVFGEVLVRRYNSANYGYFLVKLSSQNLGNTIQDLTARWKDLFPNAKFDYFFLDSFFYSFYKEEKQFTGVFAFFSIIGIIISCMGLFGLSLYTTTSRTKEIGIRKSLGGTAGNIVWLFSKDYLKLVLAAALLGMPTSYWLLNQWLENYPSRITLQADAILLPMLAMIFIATSTVGYQTFKAARMNPVQSLKTE